MSQFLALLGQQVDQKCSGTSGTSPKVGRSLNKNLECQGWHGLREQGVLMSRNCKARFNGFRVINV